MSDKGEKYKPDLVEGYLNAKCCMCVEPATSWWPAYHQTVEPKPYCQKHLAEAEKTLNMRGPRMWTVEEFKHGGIIK